MSTSFSRRTSPKQMVSREESDIVWSSSCWKCSNQLKHYTTLSRRGAAIHDFHVHSFVRILNERGQEKIGYIDDLYEDLQGNKIARVQYFCYSNEIRRHFPDFREIIFTSSPHEIHPRSIDGVAAVLNPADLSKWENLLFQTPSPKPFVCEMKVKDGNLHSFDPSSLRGYSDQPILQCLKHYEEVSNQERNLALEPDVLRDVEVLFQKDGVPCYWRRCESLRSSQKKRAEVLHYDLVDDNGQRKKEFVPIEEFAGEDMLGLRREERRTVRPWPRVDPLQFQFELGKPVDVWQGNAWWEGIMMDKKLSEDGKLDILAYIPALSGVNKFVWAERKDIRISMEWVHGRWLNLDANPDIRSMIEQHMIAQPKENPAEPPPPEEEEPPQTMVLAVNDSSDNRRRGRGRPPKKKVRLG